MASHDGHAEVVRAPLAVDGINANQARTDDGSTALTLAAWQGHTEIVRALLAVDGIDANAVCTDTDDTALILASQEGHAEVVRALLAACGVGVNHARTADGFTALIMASQEGHAEVVRALLTVDGIDANVATTDEGSTALIMASQRGHVEVVRALLATNGVDANIAATDDSGTALMFAVSNGHLSCARTLAAARGVNINVQAPLYSNNSALHEACEELNGAMRADVADLLLVAGGCRFQLNDDGKTPLDLAGGDKGVLEVFASGVDYWQRKRHGGHAWVTREAVATVLLVRQRLDARAAQPPAPPAHGRVLRSRSAALTRALPHLPHLPEEIWLAVCAFLRGADFMP